MVFIIVVFFLKSLKEEHPTSSFYSRLLEDRV